MDSKKVIEKLIKIAESQQKIISRLAQATDLTDKDPMGALPEYTGPRYDANMRDVNAPAAPKVAPTPAKANPLLAPIGTKLTEEEWRAMEKQRGMKPGESSDAVHPDWVTAPQHGQQAVTNAPGTQGGPPKASKPNLTPDEIKYLDLLKKKNQ
jgi:hypothetical protein